MAVVDLESAWSTDSREPVPGADRQPPQDIIAEQSVLGAMLISKDAIAEVLEIVRGDDFYKPAHELIFDAVLHLYSVGEPADAITVAEQLTKRGEISRVGGHAYLYDLVASVAVAANAGYYAEIVRDKAILRRLVQASIKIAQLGYNAEGDVDDIVDEAQATMYQIADRRTTEDYKPLEQLIEPTMDQMELIEAQGGVMAGVPTGFMELDELTAGLHGGQMVIIAARPGMGKSTLGLDICRSASIKHGLASCIFSLEMGQTEITMRMLSAEASVSLSHMRQGTMSSEEWDRVSGKASLIGSAPLFVDDSPNMTMMEIRAKARRLKQQHDLKLIVLDYLQLMSSGKKVESRQLEVSEFSRQMKLLAKELDIPVIAISQLNRNSEKRDDKKPSVSDLRESGSLEQDADVIMLVHRHDYYNKDESDRVGEADIIVAKHRNGPTKTIVVAFQGHYSRFVDMPH